MWEGLVDCRLVQVAVVQGAESATAACDMRTRTAWHMHSELRKITQSVECCPWQQRRAKQNGGQSGFRLHNVRERVQEMTDILCRWLNEEVHLEPRLSKSCF